MTAYVSPLVTVAELEQLTGRTRPTEQKRWLDKNGIRYAMTDDGKVTTTWGLVEKGLSNDYASNLPNFEALNGR